MNALNGNFMDVFNSLLIIGLMIWIVYRIFTLTKRILKGWDKKGWKK